MNKDDIDFKEYVSRITIFGLKNDCKKRYRKNTFEIPPCAKHFLENLFYFIERWIFTYKLRQPTGQRFSKIRGQQKEISIGANLILIL